MCPLRSLMPLPSLDRPESERSPQTLWSRGGSADRNVNSRPRGVGMGFCRAQLRRPAPWEHGYLSQQPPPDQETLALSSRPFACPLPPSISNFMHLCHPVPAPREPLPHGASRWQIPSPALPSGAGFGARSALAFWARVMTFDLLVESSFLSATCSTTWSISWVLRPGEADPGPKSDLWRVFIGVPVALPLPKLLALPVPSLWDLCTHCLTFIVLFLHNYSSLLLWVSFFLPQTPVSLFPLQLLFLTINYMCINENLRSMRAGNFLFCSLLSPQNLGHVPAHPSTQFTSVEWMCNRQHILENIQIMYFSPLYIVMSRVP